MRLHRFFVSKPLEHTKEIIFDGRLIHQWRDVFRYNVGSEVILFDGCGQEFSAVIEKLTNREAEIRLVSEREGIMPGKNSLVGSGQKIILCQSLIKKDKMEWIVEKATELGVSKIIPIISERSEKKGFNLERAKKIAIEASEQCGRADVPEIFEIQDLEITLSATIVENSVIVFDKNNSLPNPSLTLREGSTPSSIAIFIGPEGGWSPKEIELFSALGGPALGGKTKGAKIYSLSPLTLRAETAAIVALSKFV